MEVGDKLNPQRSCRKGFALKGLRQHIIKTNNPSTIGPDELLTVCFPDLKENQVIIPSTTKLTFNISLAGTDVNRTLVRNLGRNIIRKLVVKLKGNEIISTDNYDILIFTKERSATKFTRDTEEFYNSKIMKVEVTMEGVPNELYAQNMEYRHQYDEIVKHFAEGQLKEAGAIQKDLQLHNVNIASYYTDKYALWLDFQTIDDNRLHGLGRQLENTSEGIRLQITKESGSVGKLSCYLYIFQDAQINISDAQFLNVVY